MSIVFHVNPATGRTGKCEATKKCRFGSDIPHYKTAGDARKAFESANSDETVPAAQSKPAAQKKPKVDLATAPLKVASRERPSWGSPCMNPKCSTMFHDIRDMEKVRKCFDAISSRLSPSEQAEWEKQQKAYASHFVTVQKRETGHLLKQYDAIPPESIKRNLKFEVSTLRRAFQADTPQYYATQAKKIDTFLKDQRIIRAVSRMDSWSSAGAGGNFHPAPVKSLSWGTAPAKHHHDDIPKHEYCDEPPRPLTDEQKILLGAKPSTNRSVASSLQRNPPAEPKAVTMDELKSYSLEKLKELEDRERELSTTVKTREVKRMFRRAELEEVKTLDYTKNYEVFNEFVAYLPPESQKVYSIYQATIHNSRLNRPEVLEYLEKEFEKAKKAEGDQFLSEPSALDEVKELIRGKV